MQHNDAPQLMITEQPQDDYQDFINYSLSDACFSISKFQSKGNNVSENSISQDYKQHIGSIPLSPIIINTKPSTDNTDQKLNQDQRPSITSTNPGRAFQKIFHYFLLQKFVHRISYKKKLNSKFDKYHFDMINDQGASLNLNLFRENVIKMRPLVVKPMPRKESQIVIKFKKNYDLLTQKFHAFLNKIPLIYPESRIKMIWDAIVMAARFYFIYVIPLDLAWETEQFMFDKLIVPTSLMLTLLILDFLLSFNNAYYEFGSKVTERKKIAQYVFTKSYGIDVLSVIILIIFLILQTFDQTQVDLTQNWYYLLLLLFLIQYKNISKLTEQAEEALNLSKLGSSLLELAKLIILLFYVLHIFSCLWFWIGYYSFQHYDKSWLAIKDIETANWNIQYLYSFYFSTVTMVTVGYGDITPQSTPEIIICIMFMMLCSVQLSYSVSTVSAIIDKISFYSKEKRKKVQTINTYMQHKKISYELQYKIREYLNYYWSCNQSEETEEEKNIINQLSENLRESLQFEANSMILNNCPLFKNHFSEQLKKKLVKKIKSIVVQPENIINFEYFFPSQKMNSFICFVEEGQIEIFIENDLQSTNLQQNIISVVSTVSKGSSLGLVSFITGIKAKERFRSVGFSKLLLLSREDFLKIIPDFPEDYEIFREMHDDLVYNSDPRFLNLSCFSCKSLQHKAIDCPMVHFIPDKEFLIKQHQFSKDQKRNESCKFKFRRNPKRIRCFFSSLPDNDLILETAECFQAENYKQCLFYEDLDDEQEKSKQISIPDPILKKIANYPIKDSIREENEDEYKEGGNLMNKSKRTLNKITKKSCSFLVDDDLQSLQQYKGITKFRKVVDVVKNINKIVNKKSFKAQTKSILASLTNSENFKILEQNQLLNSIVKRQKYIEDHNIEWVDSDLQQMEFLRMKLRMLDTINKQKFDKFDLIDTVKQYKFYNIHNNVDTVLITYNQFYKVKLKELQDIPEIFRKFVRYLMYPYSFINKYKFKQDNFYVPIQKQEDKQKPKNRFSKLLTLHKQSKNLRKKFLVKKAQIQPL